MMSNGRYIFKQVVHPSPKKIDRSDVNKYTLILKNKLFNGNNNYGFMLDENKEERQFNQMEIEEVNNEERKELINGNLCFISNRIYEIIGNYDLIKYEIKPIIDFKIKLANSNLNVVRSKVDGGVIGQYLPTINTIIINNRKSSTLVHELLHYLSTEYSNGIMKSGFYCINYNINTDKLCDIGVGINEGYTEYLNKTIKYNNDPVYPFYVEIAAAIAKIVGEENMLKFYLKHDLLGLIELLEYKNFSNKEIYDLIIGTDFLLYSYKSTHKYKNLWEISKTLKRIKTILSKDRKLSSYNTSLKEEDIKMLIKTNFNVQK